MKKIFFLLLMILECTPAVISQNNITVKCFAAREGDQDARVNFKRNDFSGHLAALIKIKISETGFNFFNGVAGFIGDIVYKPGEVWLYVPMGSKKITISHPRYGSLRDYEIPVAIDPGIVYEMVLDLGIDHNTDISSSEPEVQPSRVQDLNVIRKDENTQLSEARHVKTQNSTMGNSLAPSSLLHSDSYSEVDQNIPINPANNENTFAVIIANENYQEEVKVEYALNDGEMFKTYCNKVLGLPEENIHIRKDATLNNMRMEIDWIAKVAHAYDGQARIIFYYAGHGIPDEKSGSSFLLPIDGSGRSTTTGYSLEKLYSELSELPSKEVVVFMDACFSGSKRGDGMLVSARGVAIKAKAEAPKGKMLVFSAAQGDETAYPFKEKKHGLFTYYLLKKLQETQGNVSLSELCDYVTNSVKRKSIVANGKSQTPAVLPSVRITNEWRNIKLR